MSLSGLSFPAVGFCGPRSLGPAGCAWVSAAAASVVGRGAVLASGCAVGADAAALSAAPLAPSRVVLFAVGSFGGAGFPAPGVPPAVAAAAAAGASVRWLAGGALALPLAARLARRSLALVRWLSARRGLLVCAASSLPSSRFGPGPFPSCGSGSWASLAAAVLAGVPVAVAPFGLAPSAFPALPGGGSWGPAGVALAGVSLWSWSPAGVALRLPGFGP